MKSANKSRENPAPPNALPGFQLFEDKASGLYYFCCGDVRGNPIFFSQAYNAKDSAATGLNAVIRNAAKPKQFKTLEDGGAHYFTLHAGNHQEIGRSIAFDDADKMLMALSYLQQVAKSEQPIAEIPQETTVKARGADLATPVDSAAKYTFRIDFYDTDGKTPKGRIEHLQSGNSMALQGLQPEVIGQFMQMRIPQTAKTPAEAGHHNAALRIVSRPWDVQPGEAPQWGGLVVLEMELGAINKAAHPVELEVSAHAIGSGPHINMRLTPITTTDQGLISFVAPAAYFTGGLYRISATARNAKSDQWSAECLMQVF
mgnify:CR=1 FL=1